MLCNRCKIECEKTGNNQKYCEDCAYIVKCSMDRVRMDKNRSIGTIDLCGHANIDDFDLEYEVCHKELLKHKFKRQFS